MKRKVRAKVVGRKTLCFIDSQVVVGAVGKGRSSSHSVDFVRRLSGMLVKAGLQLHLGDCGGCAEQVDQFGVVTPRPTGADMGEKLMLEESADNFEKNALYRTIPRLEGVVVNQADDRATGDNSEKLGDPLRQKGTEFRSCGVGRLSCLPCRGEFWESFGGSCALSQVVKANTGAPTVPGVDLARGPWKLDLNDTPVGKFVSIWIKSGRLRRVHLAPPCRSFSQARRGATRKRMRENVVEPESADVSIKEAHALARVRPHDSAVSHPAPNVVGASRTHTGRECGAWWRSNRSGRRTAPQRLGSINARVPLRSTRRDCVTSGRSCRRTSSGGNCDVGSSCVQETWNQIRDRDANGAQPGLEGNEDMSKRSLERYVQEAMDALI